MVMVMGLLSFRAESFHYIGSVLFASQRPGSGSQVMVQLDDSCGGLQPPDIHLPAPLQRPDPLPVLAMNMQNLPPPDESRFPCNSFCDDRYGLAK
jgi:hypothetical protein